jgi:hypothetical protein
MPVTVAKDTQRRHVKKRDFMSTLTPCVQKLAGTFEIKSTDANQKYSQRFALVFTARRL